MYKHILFARKPVAPVTKMALFSRCCTILPNSMEEKYLQRRRRRRKKKVDMEATHTHIVYIYIVGNFLHMTHFALLFYLPNPKRKRVKGNDPATLAS
jgi:hypothetical protein